MAKRSEMQSAEVRIIYSHTFGEKSKAEMIIFLPFDFESSEEKANLYDTWRKTRNVPLKYSKEHEQIAQLPTPNPVFNMSVVMKDGRTGISLGYNGIKDPDHFLITAKNVFGSGLKVRIMS